MTAEWVRRIFEWYVELRLSIDESVRRMNADDSIPLGPMCSTGQWTHDAVRYLLNNPRHRGWWRYGVTQAVWQSKKDYSRQIERREPLRVGQFEDLRIVSDDIWYRAPQRLAENDQTAAGRKPRDGDQSSRPRLLNGLFYCAVHNVPLYVGGSYGKHMFCRRCRELPSEQRARCIRCCRACGVRVDVPTAR